MKPLTAAEIRTGYLEFCRAHGHKVMSSDSLVPANDPTLLFTGAGMNQFKDMFLGTGSLPWKRVATAQKCLRVPDLDNVGLTPRHHTFFEMLGNFSFGDYFKSECVRLVWTFFREVCGIPAERLVVTIYTDDDEAFSVWTKEIGMPAARIYRFGEKENFWPAEAPSKGPNGPCGPCSEIYFDTSPEQPLPPQAGLDGLPSARFLEIGNCVFTQFDRQADGALLPLPQKNIDVGLGLERIAAVLQGAPNNFETELFRPYLDQLGRLTGKPYGQDDRRDVRMRRIADHVRAITFCIADGALPSNEGRGYVVRKILRRAARDGYELGLHRPFLFELVDLVGQVMGDAYPEVRDNRAQCRAVIRGEEENFLSVYRQGMARLDEFLSRSTAVRARGALLPGSGEFAFTLHDTYGFPVDITQKVLEERGFALDSGGFEAAMTAQRERARASMATADAVFTASVAGVLRAARKAPTAFVGYERLAGDAPIVALLGDGDAMVERVVAGQRAVVVAAETPFYAAGGGQIGDRGRITTATGVADVVDTTALDGYHLHHVMVAAGTLAADQVARFEVDADRRRATERNHTATHLLHAALKSVFGDHVSQAGSEVAPERLRFDYTQPEKPTPEQLQAVEDLVNAEILAATEVQACVQGLDAARRAGFIALFGEKYGDQVRTLQVGGFSKELCGGTHVRNTGSIGSFRIVSDAAVAAGTRRIEAVTGTAALALSRQERAALAGLAALLKVPATQVAERVQEIAEELKRTRRELERALAPDLDAELGRVGAAITVRDGISTVVYERPGLLAKDAQELLRRAQQQWQPFAGVVLSPGGDGVQVAVAVSAQLTDRLRAGDLVRQLAGLLGGGGGGRPEAAQGKGKDGSRLAEAVAAAAAALQAAGLRA